MNTNTSIINTSAEIIPLPAVQVSATLGKRSRKQTAPAPAPELHPTAPPAPEPKHERCWFEYRGRQFRIFKRYGQKWYLYFEHKKKRFKHCLGAVDKRAAEATAKIKIAAVLDGHLATLKASMERQATEYCTIPALITSYESLPLDISERTQRTNVNCFKLVLRRGTGLDSVDELTAGALNADTARLYFEHELRRAKHAADQETAARIKRSANSMFNQARSLLHPKILAAYVRAGLALPDVAGFLGSYKAERFGGVTAIYNPPSEPDIRRTLHEWLKLQDRNMFLAVGLALACGLRKAEIAQVRWGMWTIRNGAPLLDGRGKVKNQSGFFSVVPIDPFWKLLNRRIDREKWRGQDDELVLLGNVIDRDGCTFRNVGGWLRGLGWKTQKTNHALRGYAGSLVAMKFDLYRASAWLRHASFKTTQQHYTHFLNANVFRPERVRISWAR